MNKYEYQEKMRKIKWAGKQKGEKWNKSTVRIAAEMVRVIKAKPKEKENWKDAKSEPMSIKEILGR